MQSVAQDARDNDTRWIDDPVLGLTSMTGLNELLYNGPTLTGHQLYILRSIALTAASMSMVSGLLVGWWFVRMKRSFRHQYIILSLAKPV
jgi:G protein-coupled receptor GPR1